MQWWHAILLGIVEGLSEFLPISSTGHLTVVEKLLGYPIDDGGDHGLHGHHSSRGDRSGHHLLPA